MHYMLAIVDQKAAPNGLKFVEVNPWVPGKKQKQKNLLFSKNTVFFKNRNFFKIYFHGQRRALQFVLNNL